ncbi:pyridoxamine 5'-phosphate oxidase [Janthinobacterium sp. J1-1]|uniref:pyridoxamine 5'-phosphate oxidase n=1 Tax=Janthinobacterium sp. J1-1 TaxID=3065910 RepID=UPI0028111C47|nr:pyridoxamine 5'-phosphate oxidase [Janthinobacterium sp. J1-1]
MTVPLFDSVPGFDQPIAVLKHCHDKIRKQLTTLQNLLAYLPQQGNTIAAQQAAKAVLQYFNKAAHLHHDDEEQDLMPMLQATASGADAALLATLVPEILADHQRMDQAWSTLRPQLDAIAAGASTELSTDGVNAYVDAYHAHMSKEESQLAPMAKRLFSAQQMEQLGTAMQRRRGIAPEEAPAAADPAAALAAMRTDYLHSSLSEADVLADPVAQFQKWFDEALKAQVGEPNAMTLSTVSPEGKPSSRIVLIKQFDARGFTWYTNYNSEKGQQLEHNPQASLLFFWRELERQVRIEGTVVKTSAAESDEYFNVRPLQSRLSAIASRQSATIGSRAELEANFDAVAAVAGDTPARPAHWGGYRLRPERIEFWQGRRSRFHDRIVFTRGTDGAWSMERLQP